MVVADERLGGRTEGEEQRRSPAYIAFGCVGTTVALNANGLGAPAEDERSGGQRRPAATGRVAAMDWARWVPGDCRRSSACGESRCTGVHGAKRACAARMDSAFVICVGARLGWMNAPVLAVGMEQRQGDGHRSRYAGARVSKVACGRESSGA
ncbi:Os08g0146400 [Oryza sativa Japonica Group]|uniref:Os08g0146400 protein n=2 Tax=Oryza sativa subsp. japonica TaxID=39947 RepID=Q69PK7_ORYSJ|nr:hypothetical protein [Oryza sativa Japonica Group]BAT03815.1 Os08g0146400 [Oryza sativa Japonica Group]